MCFLLSIAFLAYRRFSSTSQEHGGSSSYVLFHVLICRWSVCNSIQWSFGCVGSLRGEFYHGSCILEFASCFCAASVQVIGLDHGRSLRLLPLGMERLRLVWFVQSYVSFV